MNQLIYLWATRTFSVGYGAVIKELYCVIDFLLTFMCRSHEGKAYVERSRILISKLFTHLYMLYIVHILYVVWNDLLICKLQISLLNYKFGNSSSAIFDGMVYTYCTCIGYDTIGQYSYSHSKSSSQENFRIWT